MRNRTALTAAVTSSAPEPPSHPGQDSLVFGKIAGPGADGTGARAQDVELFDTTLTLTPPNVPRETRPRGRHGAGKSRHARNPSRSRTAARKPEREQGAGLSLPLLIAGALAAGIGLTVGLTSGLDPQPPDSRYLTMPDLPHLSPPADTEPPTVTHVSAPPSATTTSATAEATPTPSHAPSSPRTPARTAPPPPPTHPPASSPPPPRNPPPAERPDTDVLRRGSSGPEVEDLQRRLARLHLYLGSTDGRFGAYVEAALIRFQASRGIPEELGVYGPATRAALRAEADREAGADRSPWGDGNDWDDADRDGRGD
ncbi:peptidoglycan-binding protein [Streptomyces sp. 2RAF24]|uniref:peptidoglycan-binding domain-containing protein n=1 Tax=Streptomyces sp. 2RAF24 TaxID=3232997 RepID=UPI003F97FC0F